MWIITPLGFFSIVQKPSDVAADTLTIRARVRSDLEALQAAVLPGLGKIAESKSTDYRYRATAPRALVEAAMAQLVRDLDYSNVKDQVAKLQGSKRAHLYHQVWHALYGLQEGGVFEAKQPAKQPPKAKARPVAIPKADAYGGVLFDHENRTLLREPAGHYGGYVWSWAKGKPEKGETPEQTALREVREETGYTCRLIGALPAVFPGTTSTTAFFLMEPVGKQEAFSEETEQTRWAGLDEARTLIKMTKVPAGVKRDLAVLEAAFKERARLLPEGAL